MRQAEWMPKNVQTIHFFVELVEALHGINPSANSAYYLGLLKDKAGDSQGALAYYEESLTLEEDQYRKATICTKLQ